jgi:hypothetical protein
LFACCRGKLERDLSLVRKRAFNDGTVAFGIVSDISVSISGSGLWIAKSGETVIPATFA